MFIIIILFSVEVRHTFDVMKFYENTESDTVYVTTHDAVMAARNALNDGIFLSFLDFKCYFLSI